MIIGLCGTIGSGKDTVANYLVQTHSFIKVSYGSILKDVVSSVFGWKRELMEGDTLTSRAFRDQEDNWWSEQLQKSITPRNMLQTIGTDVFRKHFHADIWVIALQHQILEIQKQAQKAESHVNIVITDCRFPNEIELVKKLGGVMIKVVRQELPPQHIEKVKQALKNDENAKEWLKHQNVHESEWYSFVAPVDHEIFNHSSKEELFCKVESILKSDV